MYFTENESVRSLLAEFKISQGALFHYTPSLAASEGICGGEIWITSADSFLDDEEIAYGLGMLREAATRMLSGADRDSFLGGLAELESRLASCYVFSLSQDPDSEYLKSNYASDDGFRLEFGENLSFWLQGGWHSIPAGDDSFLLHYVVDHYDVCEGFVVYDEEEQRRISDLACEVFQDLLSGGGHLVDSFHLVSALIQCLILFKRASFSPEVEYRIALLRKAERAEDFSETRDREDGQITYIAVRISPKGIPSILP